MSDEQKPVAWLHAVRDTGGDREPDFALSFAPDNFPLQGMFESLSVEPLYDQAALDRLNSERLDLALLIGRLIHRMRTARDGRGIAAGDEALEQQAIGYLRRKGLISPLREDGPNADLSGRTRSA